MDGARTPAQINFAAPTVAVAVNRICREREAAATEDGMTVIARERTADQGALLGRVTDQRGAPLDLVVETEPGSP